MTSWCHVISEPGRYSLVSTGKSPKLNVSTPVARRIDSIATPLLNAAYTGEAIGTIAESRPVANEWSLFIRLRSLPHPFATAAAAASSRKLGMNHT